MVVRGKRFLVAEDDLFPKRCLDREIFQSEAQALLPVGVGEEGLGGWRPVVQASFMESLPHRGDPYVNARGDLDLHSCGEGIVSCLADDALVFLLGGVAWTSRSSSIFKAVCLRMPFLPSLNCAAIDIKYSGNVLCLHISIS